MTSPAHVLSLRVSVLNLRLAADRAEWALEQANLTDCLEIEAIENAATSAANAAASLLVELGKNPFAPAEKG